MKQTAILLLLANFFFASTLDMHGQIGYINLPSANTFKENGIIPSVKRGYYENRFSILASPFNNIDINLFYVDILKRPYPGSGLKQSYKDKGVNLKFSKNINSHFKFAFGARDFGGTSLFSSEYVVLTHNINNLNYSIGLGWGKLSGGTNFKNPLISLSNNFKFREDFEDLGNQGGKITENLLKGEKVGIFFGSQYDISNKFSFFLEYDSTIYNQYYELMPQSKFNYGLQYSNKTVLAKLASIRGSDISLQLSIPLKFSDFTNNKKFTLKEKPKTFSDFQELLARASIGLKSIKKNDEVLVINTRQNSYTNQHEPNRIIYSLSQELSDKKHVVIEQEMLAMKFTSIVFENGKKINIREENYRNINDLESVYLVNEKYPIVNNNISPQLRAFVASREGFIFQALLLEDDLEIVFKENLIFLANFKYSLSDNFDLLYIPPRDTYPNQVRSDVKKYLNNFDNGVVLGRMEMNYFTSFNTSHFIRLSAGIFEEMFGGIGAEYLYYPQGSIFSFGFETFYLKKRSYDMKLDFQDYENTLSRISFNVMEPYLGLSFKTSFGEYIAGDKGFTFEIGRRFDNGISFSAFFSRTNVPEHLYGEGSFDKGFKMVIPFSFFNLSGEQNLSKFVWRPLTKDPASLVIKSIDLQENSERFRVY